MRIKHRVLALLWVCLSCTFAVNRSHADPFAGDGKDFVTILNGHLRVIARQDFTNVRVTRLDNANTLLWQVTIAKAGQMVTQVIGNPSNNNAEHVRIVADKPVLVSSDNIGLSDAYGTYLVSDNNSRLGKKFEGYTRSELIVFCPVVTGSPATSITVTDVTDQGAANDDSTVLTNANATFKNANVEIWALDTFDDDQIRIDSNKDCTALVGHRLRTSPLRDWSVIHPALGNGEFGRSYGTKFYTFVHNEMVIIPTQDNTKVTINDLSDNDDTRSLTLNRTQVFSSRPFPSTYNGYSQINPNPANEFDNDFVEVISDKPIWVYSGPVTSDVNEHSTYPGAIPFGQRQEYFCFVQNGGAKDFQIFAPDRATEVTITTIAGRNSDNQLIVKLGTGTGLTPWLGPTTNGPVYWETDQFITKLIRIESTKPIVAMCGDFDKASWGSFLFANSANRPPHFTNTAPPTVFVGQPYGFTPQATDPEGGAVTYKLTSGPTGATIDPTTGLISWTPGTPGNSTFEVEACDPSGACSTYKWDVTAFCQDSVAFSDWKWFTDGVVRSVTAQPEYGDIAYFQNAPTALPEYTNQLWLAPPSPRLVNHLTTTFAANKARLQFFWYTTALYIPAGLQANTFTFTSTADNGVLIKIFNSTYPNGIQPVTSHMQLAPSKPTSGNLASFLKAGEVNRILYILADNGGVSNTGNIVMTLNGKNISVPTNLPPVVTQIPPTSTPERALYSATPVQATDADGDALVYTLSKAPTGATIDPTSGVISWTPGAADVGKSFDFEVTVNDNHTCGGVKRAWKVTVTNVNDKPSITGTPPTQAYVGEPVSYQPSATDPDPGDKLTWSLKSGPPGATVDPNTGEFKWTPAAGDSDKQVSITIEVCDDGTPKLCESQTFSLTPRTRCIIDASCPTTQICVQQQDARICVPPGCADQNPKCPQSTQFCQQGACINNPCTSKQCPTGTVCRPNDGKCIKSCTGVTCPTGETCEGGTCVADPCKAAPCSVGDVCNTSDPKKPTCIQDPCSTTSCRHGRACDNGTCVDDPCGAITCPDAKERCVAGQCVPRSPCAVDIDCPDTLVCVGKLCVDPGCYTKNPRCSTANQRCIETNCQADKCADGSLACATGEFCRPTDNKCVKPCAGVTCPSGELCQDGACITDPCSGKTCAAGEICVNGTCEKENCKASNVCKSGRICDPGRNLCTDDLCANVTCPDAKQVCIAGQCQPPNQCKFDADCPGTALCVKGKCVVPTCPTTACPQDKLCVDGLCLDDPCKGITCSGTQYCVGGTCIDSCAGVFCPTGEKCIAGTCTKDPCDGKTCATGEVCRNGTCVKDECTPTACKSGRLCNVNLCEDNPCANLTCPTGQTCKDGQCTGDRSCTHDADCPATAVCINSLCKPSGCYTQPCPAGKLCLQGACVDDPCQGKQCANDEYCSPSESGNCKKVCPTCTAGEICKDGKCEKDPCDGINCPNGESCDPTNGNCIPNPCHVPGTQLCRHQRLCQAKNCSDDACTGVTCATGQTCRDGKCVAPQTSPESVTEPTTEPTTEPVAEPAAEPVIETAAEPATEPTTDASTNDAIGGDLSITESPGSDVINIENGNNQDDGNNALTKVSGGCGCQSSAPSWPSLLLLLALLGLLLRRRPSL